MTRSTGRRALTLFTFLVGALGFAASSYGHALEPGYLQLRLLDKELYAVVWKTPASKSRPIDMTRLAWARAVPPYVIGSIAAFWTFQRLAAY